jgi:nucleobase:cation symporter-1, NCS1 family
MSVGSADSLEIETRSIDFIPANERQGRARDLLTLWFGANAMAITLVTGGVAATLGIGLVWSSLAIVTGAAIGSIFVAYHSAQGPQLGLPQMIQSRAQFGFYGANIPMVIVVAMYLGFYAGGAVVGAEALSSLLGAKPWIGVAAVSALSLVLVIFGYKMLHLIGRIVTPLYVLSFALLTFALVKNWHTFPGVSTVSLGKFALTPFMAIVSIVAAYQISYGPYVADYSRYLPESTSSSQAFWYTYAGIFASTVWIMVLGAGIQVAFAADDTVGGAAKVAGSLGSWSRSITLVTVIAGIANINAFNIYGAMMSSLTIATSFLRKLRVGRSARAGFIVAATVLGALLAAAASQNFISAFENFVFFIITFLIPWSAVNLVDYYAIRKGAYVASDLFTPNGRYGSFNVIGFVSYACGALAQVPFIDQDFYKGFAAARIGFDVAWIVGLGVSGLLYWMLANLQRRAADA